MKNTKKNRFILLVLIAAVVTVSYAVYNVQADTDSDGLNDLFDNCPNEPNPTQDNFDSDSQGDVCDFDDDNDGIVDNIDAFAYNPEEWDDFDFDGIGANEDTDDDNDGILDSNDPLPTPISSQLTTKYLDLIEDCAIMDPGLQSQFCYNDFFLSLFEQGESAADIINAAFFLAKLGPITDCHFVAHHLGHAAFKKNPDLTENIMNASSICRQGFYHGVVSEFFDNLKNDGEEISNSHKTICEEFVDTEHYDRCVHAIGHGFAIYYGDNLESAIDSCNEMSVETINHCKNGAIMQYVDFKLIEAESFEEIIPEICFKNELTTSDKERCYLQMGAILMFVSNRDYSKSIEFCGLVIDADDENYCVTGVGRELTTVEFKKEFENVPFN